MKQRFLLTLLAFFGMFVGVWAEDNPYGLKICGVDVTDDNKGDLIAVINSKDGCSATGTMNYDSDTQTLTLNGVTASSVSIEIRETVTFNLVGTNTLTNTSTSPAIVVMTGNAYTRDANNPFTLTFKGAGSLTVQGLNASYMGSNFQSTFIFDHKIFKAQHY